MQCNEEPVAPDFGAPYAILIDNSIGAPESLPEMADDWLLLKISYSGGCVDHVFELERDVRKDTAHIWLKHTIPTADSCEDTISDDLSIQLPFGVHTHHTIALHLPPGGAPYMLKWRQ